MRHVMSPESPECSRCRYTVRGASLNPGATMRPRGCRGRIDVWSGCGATGGTAPRTGVNGQAVGTTTLQWMALAEATELVAVAPGQVPAVSGPESPAAAVIWPEPEPSEL